MGMVKEKVRSMHNSLNKLMVSKILRNSITGDIEDLQHLEKYLHRVSHIPGLSDYLKGLLRDANNKSGSALLFERIGKQLNTSAKKQTIENFLYSWAVKGKEKHEYYYHQEGLCVPRFVVLSPTMRCNLHCRGCYSGLYDTSGELSFDEIDDVIHQAREIGSYFMVISGGEPFVRKEELLELFEKYHDMFFMVYTNGTLIDDKTIAKLAELGNVAPAISLEGYEAETDRRRGKGVYEQATRTIRALSDAGILTGASITYTRENVELVSTPEYVDHLIDLGAVFAWYFMFMPVGSDPVLDLVPTPRQRRDCGNRISEIRKSRPIFLADFWNDGPAAGGCLAGGKTYLHILHDGSIEPCVFAHFKVANIRKTPLKYVSSTPFFRSIREEFPYNKEGNLKRPCMIIDNPEVLRSAVQKHVANAGHDHSEDLVKDPKVIAWIDEYAKEFAALTDKQWLEEIEKPESRWYKEGNVYKNLFSRSYRRI